MTLRAGDTVELLEGFDRPGGGYMASGMRGTIVRRILPRPGDCDLEKVEFEHLGKVVVSMHNLVLIHEAPYPPTRDTLETGKAGRKNEKLEILKFSKS